MEKGASMNVSGRILAATALALLPLCADAAVPLRARLVRDINTDFEAGLSDPQGFVAGPGRVYFVATTPETGTELFSIDGTSANGGMRLEVDLAPGTASSNPRADKIWPGSRTIYFVAAFGDDSTDLFALDSVTRIATDLGDVPLASTTVAHRSVAVVGDRLFFVPRYDTPALWTSDGTTAGTITLDAAIGAERQPVAGSLVAQDNAVYFLVNGPANMELWRSDGSLAGTLEVAALDGPTSASVPCAISYGGAYWMLGQRSIWRHAFGSTTMERLSDLPDNSLYFECRASGMGASLYYILSPSPTEQLWRSGPSVGDTVLVKALEDDPDFSTAASDLATVGDHLVFWKHELWRSDGTDVGTAKMSVPEGTIQPWNPPCCFRDVDGQLLFEGLAAGQSTPSPIWITDGTDAGTHPLGSPFRIGMDNAAVFGARVYGALLGELGSELPRTMWPEIWSTDGTATGIGPAATVWPGTVGTLLSFQYDGSTRVDGTTLLFPRYDAVTPQTMRALLWKSDGTEAGTFGISPDVFDGFMYEFAAGSGHRAIFRSESPWGIYVADAALDHVEQVAGDYPLNFHGYDSATGPNAIFTCDYASGTEPGLCGLDPTLSSRVPLSPDAGNGELRMVGSVNGIGLFFSNDAFEPWTLWRTDGTAAGTYELAAVSQLTGSMYDNVPSIMRDGRIYFGGCDANSDCSLYTSDGTVSGTRALGEIGPYGIIDSFAFAGDRLLFTADMNGGAAGPYSALWSHELGMDGATLVLDARSLGASTMLTALASGGDVVRFASLYCTFSCNSLLWSSDGTTAGTLPLLDPIPWQVTRGAFVAFDDAHSVFTCSAPDIGEELCETDGTASGTRLIRDIFPGPLGSRLAVATANGRIYLSADDGHHGMELWTLDGDPIFADGFDANP
jgi:ELWxxDGT repeat protein